MIDQRTNREFTPPLWISIVLFLVSAVLLLAFLLLVLAAIAALALAVVWFAGVAERQLGLDSVEVTRAFLGVALVVALLVGAIRISAAVQEASSKHPAQPSGLPFGRSMGRGDSSKARGKLPPAERQHVEALLKQFCERVPEPVRAELWYSYRIRAGRVSLFEGRPGFRDPKKKTDLEMARFEYQGDGSWMLLCADRNANWHVYQGMEAVSFEEALEEVSEDPTGIFLG